jgi:fatty acid desaturase
MSILNILTKEELRRLSTKSNIRATWMTVANLMLVAAGFAIPIWWTHWLAWVLSSIVLAGRALGLAVLVHDTAHQTLFTSRAVNAWAGKWLFGGLPNVPYQAYRTGHLAHHRHAGTEQDPDIAFVDSYPAGTASLLRKALRDVSGLNGLKNIYYQLSTFKLSAQLPFFMGHATVLAILWGLGHPEVYACWWLGQIFVFPLLLRLRVMGEHGAVPDHIDPEPRRNTRTTMAGPLARLLCSPNFVNFHLEHHFAAGVPSYRLKEMHALMVSKGAYAGWNCISPSYRDVIRRCWTSTPRQRAALSERRAKGALNNMQ